MVYCRQPRMRIDMIKEDINMSEMKRLTDDALLAVAGGRQDDIAVAYAVIDGRYGNGQDRINRLRAAGYDPYAIQQVVNYILSQPRYLQYDPPFSKDPYLG